MTIQHVGIIGAGTMGNGIAQACAVAGLPVTMVDSADPMVAVVPFRTLGNQPLPLPLAALGDRGNKKRRLLRTT